MRSLCVLVAAAACALACGKKPAGPAADAGAPATAPAPRDAAPAPPPAPAAAAARRWRYQAELTDGEGKRSSHEIVMTETGRTKVAGRDAIQLAVAIDGERPDETTLEKWSAAPFTTFSASLTLVVGAREGQRAVWLFFGAAAELDARTIEDFFAEPPTWPLAPEARRRKEPRHPPEDEPYVFGRKIGAWESVCRGIVHPAPESGDSYASEACFEPATGITRMRFDSVWGGYRLELVSAPSDFSL